MNGKAAAENSSPKKPAGKKPESKTESGSVFSVICIVLICLSAIVILFSNPIDNGAEALAKGYDAAFAEEKEAAYRAFYQKYYDKAESENHVANRASIYIGNYVEAQKLEVLKVRDVEFIVENSGDNPDNITSWLEVPGEGTYIVDLSAAEFIVDNERANVSVRLPCPELTNVRIDYSNVRKILFKDDVFDGSYKQGEELAEKQLELGELLIKKEFASNVHFYKNAQDAAESTIKCLIRELNPKVENLTVNVEFY